MLLIIQTKFVSILFERILYSSNFIRGFSKVVTNLFSFAYLYLQLHKYQSILCNKNIRHGGGGYSVLLFLCQHRSGKVCTTFYPKTLLSILLILLSLIGIQVNYN